MQTVMRWQLKHADLLSEPAEALIVSANPQLHLSGGVEAALLNRYGQDIQTELQYHLKKLGKRYVEPTDVAPTFGGGVPYKVVVHAVAIDAFYDTSPDWVTAALDKALQLAARYEARTVAAAALATGYGQMPMIDFAVGLKPLLRRTYAPIEQVTLCLSNREKYDELVALLPELGSPLAPREGNAEDL
jgi:O-acetyl-ADP-ribose deacetylase (regulator of RNase III)